MPITDLSIVVVDDTRFSSALIAKSLSNAGYTNIRTAESGREALALIKEQAADILITDWLMPEMNGLELSATVHDWEEGGSHYTYCLLVTGKETPEALEEAFQGDIDDFIYKSALSQQLLPRVKAAARNAQQRNTLLKQHFSQHAELQALRSTQVKDPVTGAGNALHAGETLNRVLKHTKSRGGAASYMLIDISNWQDISEQYKARTRNELASSVTNKLRNLVRPMDEVCRMNDHQFVVIAHFANSENCKASTYKRIIQGLDNQSLHTSSGYIHVKIASAICFVEEHAEQVSLEQLEDFSLQLLEEDSHSGIVVSPWKATA